MLTIKAMVKKDGMRVDRKYVAKIVKKWQINLYLSKKTRKRA